MLLLLLRYLTRVLHGLKLLLLLLVLLETVELVVLKQDALLDHRLVRLGEEVILLDIVGLVRADDFGHVALQVVALEDFVLLLLGRRAARSPRLHLATTIADLLLVHSRELLGGALLNRVGVQAVHVVLGYELHLLLLLLLGSRRRLTCLVGVFYGAFRTDERV